MTSGSPFFPPSPNKPPHSSTTPSSLPSSVIDVTSSQDSDKSSQRKGKGKGKQGVRRSSVPSSQSPPSPPFNPSQSLSNSLFDDDPVLQPPPFSNRRASFPPSSLAYSPSDFDAHPYSPPSTNNHSSPPLSPPTLFSTPARAASPESPVAFAYTPRKSLKRDQNTSGSDGNLFFLSFFLSFADVMFRTDRSH